MARQHEAGILRCFEPQLVALEPNLVAAVFPLMKIYPAEYSLRRAGEEGWVTSQTLVVESSSGNMALGLAIVCRLRGYRLALVSDCACDPLLRLRLEDLGARVEIVPAPAESGGYQQARLDRLDAIRAGEPDHWWVHQYDNPCNAGAYGPFAAQLVEALGRIDYLVGTVGSGGSMCGTAEYLRDLFPELVVAGVDTFGSVLFGQPDGPRTLRGLGNSLLPANLQHTLFDEVHWVTAAEAFLATRLLHRQTTLFRGATSGAAWMVAAYLAREHPRATVVCICPDDGWRYVGTVYDDRYLSANGLALQALPSRPRDVDHPLSAGPAWSRLAWRRRRREEVVSSAREIPA